MTIPDYDICDCGISGVHSKCRTEPVIDIPKSNELNKASTETISYTTGEPITFLPASCVPSFIMFNNNNQEVLKITEESFTYKGVEIKDAGEAHRAFVAAMNIRIAENAQTKHYLY
jgi:hypothetical protein